MRILHVSTYYHPSIGGMENYVKAISERLASRGHEVTVYAERRLGSAADSAKSDLPLRETINGVSVRRFEPVQLVGGWVRQVPGSYRVLRAVFGQDGFRALCEGPWFPSMLLAIARAKPEVVMVAIAEQEAMLIQFGLVCRWLGIPLVGMPLLHLDPSTNADIIAPMLSRTDAVITMTEVESRYIEKLCHRPPRTYAIGAGVDPDAFAQLDGPSIRARHGLSADPVVAFVGRFTPGKGVTQVIEAMRIVWRQLPDARLLLTGHRSLQARLDKVFQASLDALSPFERSRLTLIEHFSDADKASIFAACDVFVLPSTQESFGIVYLEAWMCRKPVVGARIDAIQCVIDDGRDGVLVTPNDPGDLAKALLTLIGDPATRAEMGERGHAKTVGRFAWDRITDGIEQIYVDLLARSPASSGKPAAEHTGPTGPTRSTGT